MEVKEEVSSTSSSIEEPPTGVESTKKPLDVDREEGIDDEPLTLALSPTSSKINGDVTDDGPLSPKIDSSSKVTQLNDADSSVTSSEPSDELKPAKELLDSGSHKPDETDAFSATQEAQSLAISSPTISATSVGSPKEQPVITCTKNDKTEFSLESFQLSSRSEVSRKEALSLVEKLAMNSSITVSRKESKPSETPKSPEIPEGRVLRLRPTPKTEPPKPAPKLPSKSTESRKASLSSNSSCDKSSSKVSKSQKRKHDDAENDVFEKTLSSPIQYKGFKKMATVKDPVKKSIITFNPFNPSFSRDCPRTLSQTCSSFDSSSLQPEYAQYLGLQPLVKFRCSNCGMSSFQTMNALNTHKAECTKNGKSVNPPVKPSFASTGHLETQTEPKSTNIKLTRKVFLCSACGTYYELWNLFLHMREAHRRYICLQCLGMSSSPEKLSEHLKQKHGIVAQTFDDPEKFASSTQSQAFYLMCVNCDKIYSEADKFSSHKCQNKKPDEAASASSKNPVVSSQTQTTEPSSLTENAPTPTPVRQSLRRTRESVRKAAKQTPTAAKKEVDVEKAPVQKIDSVTDSGDSLAAVGKSDAKLETIKAAPDPVQDSELKKSPSQVQELEQDTVPPSESPPSHVPNVEESAAAGVDALHPHEGEAESKKDDTEMEVPPPESMVPDPDVPKDEVPETRVLDSDVPLVPPLSLFGANRPFKPKVEKRAPRKPARRKRPLTMKSRSKKPKRLAIPPLSVNPSGLLPNPLNSIDYPSADVDDSAVDSTIGPIREEKKLDPLKENLPSHDFLNKLNLPPNIFKLKLNPGLDSEGDSDDSQKLSLVVDESANNSDAETKIVDRKENEFNSLQTSLPEQSVNNGSPNEITLAGEDIQPMALALDDKIENIAIQSVLKECVRTSCLSCNYCRHAHKIAVNGKHLALHLLSEHRYLPIKNETPEDVINKLKESLDLLENMCFNTETYDNTDPTIHVPHDQDTTFDCFQCNFACGTHKDLFTHKRKFHSKPLLLCIMCKTNFFSYSEMLCHLCPGHYKAEIMFHNLNINYRCCFCRLDTIPSAFRLMVHLRKTHHTCDICLEGCSDQQKLSTHLWKHKVNHLCYRCGISYASKPDITKHLFWKHGHESVLCKKCLQKKWPHVYHFCIPPTSFICEECSASFSKAVALKVHKRLHALEFPYSCSECGKKFISNKLLQRHEDRHRNIELNQNGDSNIVGAEDDQKDEIINVTDVVDVKEENEVGQTKSKDENDEVKEKSHRKHKKDKKDKVVDLYDLPPLNLSSDSDSSDDEASSKKADEEDRNDQSNGSSGPISASASELVETSEAKSEGLADETSKVDGITEEIRQEEPIVVPTSEEKGDGDFKEEEKSKTVEAAVEDPASKREMERQVEGIWENFYKTNPTNHNLPYPLCAMKSEVAYGIIMGDHDYCLQVKTDPIIKDDLPTPSNLETGFEDKIDEDNVEKPAEPSIQGDDKRKGKSPKKKIKTSNDNESSSSSDSSSDSDSSSCTCGTNCSCSSSSSNSSSSSSSDSDSSGDEKAKQERHKKKKERKAKQKPEVPLEVVKEVEEKPPKVDDTPRVPVDPPIQESELETDESSTDEEFYDKQPGRIANQIIAEKRNQLIQSVAPNNGSAANSPLPEAMSMDVTPAPKTKTKEKKRRRPLPKPKIQHARQTSDPLAQLQSMQTPPVSQFVQYPAGTGVTPRTPGFAPYDSPAQVRMPYQSTPDSLTTPNPATTPSSATTSDNDKSRSSKRRRIPNKFYGYSSGEEEERNVLKWKKQEPMPIPAPTVSRVLAPVPIPAPTPTPPPLPPPPPPTSTPRIQLTVPKQIIRKPSYHKVQKTPKITIAPPPPVVAPPPPPDSSETDSDTDVRAPPFAPSHPPSNEPSSSKPEKDVYCYCRCPYDEVSEMIACDDETCPIEWFHFECVGILVPPRGQWFCPGCRKARGLPT